MKVLLSAFACEPGLGSEEGVGWNMVLQAAKYHEVWVFTRTFCQPFIEAELDKNPVPNLHFIYFDPFGWSEDWKGRQGLLQFHYYLWQIWAYFVARKLHREVGFDLVRHVTYVKHWSPSFLALLPVPFIWGPVGGAESAPKTFWNEYSRRGKIYETLRQIAQGVGERDPFTALTARRSAMALATTEETAQRLRSMKAKNVQVFSQVGLSEAEISKMAEYAVDLQSPVRFISVGRLLHWKGVQLSLRAFALANLEGVELWIVGDGPERSRLEALAGELGIADKVQFWGALPRNQTLQKMGECHALLHPSLHESGGFVCAEMMALGRPVICLDLGGPATQVTDETGIKVPAVDPEKAVKGLAEAISRLAGDQALRERMGQAGQKRLKEVFDWDVKGEFFARLCENVLAQNQTLRGGK
ncbi:glycosyltransferase family 4 protein [Microcoleus sp. FACHB-68]|uniref:glycosyltransferase family 4 protein n=1 Tax=Microcoleus sp. FACHB-68 TaxID=2692826 RepID=UPI0016821FD1|nr:glycosyltransferase family 4 protein [Microcoleus sp. FACHB-68]MBD1936050.1 glycosyltransferase family 4 protein [Microcoleus sp. FACHB-68]